MGIVADMAENADVLRKRLGDLARELVRVEFDGEGGVYAFQLRILHLLIDVQTAIRERKAKRPSKDRAESLTDLRFLKEQTYEIGNAFAWLMLGLDRRAIGALRRNRKAPPPERDRSLEGVKAITGYLASQGHGFPMLHDITTCLRIGDVTFVDVSQSPTYLWTCEIKTTRLPSKPGDLEGTVDLEIQVHSVTPPPPNALVDQRSELRETDNAGAVSEVDFARQRKPDRRLGRQLARMRTANTHMSAPTGEVTEIDGERHFIHMQRQENRSNIHTAKALSSDALERGWTAAELEPGVAFAALSIDDGAEVGGPWMTEPMDRVKEILLADGFEGPDGVSLTFFPSREATGHIDAIPYHLVGLSEEVVVALSTGKMLLLLAVRVSAVYAKLEEAGLSVLHNGTFDLWGDNAAASRTIATPKGDATVEFHFGSMAAESLREFHTLDDIASRISEALDAVEAGGIVDEYLAALERAGEEFED